MTTLFNPLLAGFHPDPSVVRVGDDFYIATSTFEYLPGVAIHHSTDFARWSHIGNVATRDGQLAVADTPTSGGAWAPSIRHREGVFHVVLADAMGRGMLHFTATAAAGPWSDGTPLGIDGIDPDLAWDDDGIAYLTYAVLGHGGRQGGIFQVRIDLEAGVPLEQPRALWSGTGLQFPEAPHLYRRGAWWYLVIAEGGTARGHAVSVARGLSPEGPFEPAPGNPRLSARSTDLPIQNVGHGDLVEGPDGQWLLVMLGVRPRGMAPGFSALGRESFVTRVEWVDDWPVFALVELTPRPAEAPLTLRFSDELGPEWLAARRFPAEFSRIEDGSLVLAGEGTGLEHPSPAFAGRRQRHQSIQWTALVDASAGVGGIAVRYSEAAFCALELRDGDAVAIAHIAGLHQEWSVPVATDAAELSIRTRRPVGRPLVTLTSDYIDLCVDDGSGVRTVATIDGRLLSAELVASFTGRVIGAYAVDGEVRVEWITEAGSDA